MIKVLIVDDSPTARMAITKMLKGDPQIRIVGTASNGKEAVEKVKRLKPDIVTLDIEMPIMNGLEALTEIKKISPETKVIVVSTATKAGTEATLKACELGADEYITKPKDAFEMMAIKNIVLNRIKAIALSSTSSDLNTDKNEIPQSLKNASYSSSIVAICSSTGGPKVLGTIIPELPKDLKVPIIIAQHMAANFTHTFADHLDRKSKITVKEAEEGEKLKAGTVYIVRGGTNLVIKDDKTLHYINIKTRYWPSGDILFESIANVYKSSSAGIILTGMGNDGAKGIKAIHEEKGITIAQDPKTAVVPTMPKKAIETGCIDYVLSPEEIVEFLLTISNQNSSIRNKKT